MLGFGVTCVVIGLIIWPFAEFVTDKKQLRRFPAPSYAAFTNLWSARQVQKGCRSLEIHRKHEQLGPIIRIQPNHISFNVPEAVQDIYGFAQHLLKDPFYYTFGRGGHFSIAATRSRADHARKRKYISNAFAAKNITEMEPVVQDQVSTLVWQLDQRCETGASVDIRQWLNYLTFDVLVASTFGESLGFLKQGSDRVVSKPDEGFMYDFGAISALQDISHFDILLSHWPNLLDWTRKLLFWHAGGRVGPQFGALSTSMITKRQGSDKPDTYTDFVHYLLKDRNGEDLSLSMDELNQEVGVLFAAGTDTTATALTHCVYYLIKNPPVLAKLRKEVDAILGRQDGPATHSQVKDMHYLRACIDEAMRLRPPISMGLPRITPPEGAKIAGHHIQGGVTVSVPTYSLHRNSNLFSDADEYKPERWFDEKEGNLCRQFVLSFSTGPRACTGRNLSYLEQTIIIATLMHRYEWDFHAESSELGTFERFNANPKEFWVKVRRREQM